MCGSNLHTATRLNKRINRYSNNLPPFKCQNAKSDASDNGKSRLDLEGTWLDEWVCEKQTPFSLEELSQRDQ